MQVIYFGRALLSKIPLSISLRVIWIFLYLLIIFLQSHPYTVFISINYIIAGTITKTELKEVMKSLGQKPTDKELEQMIKSVDKDNNNEIDFEEFLTLMSSKKPGKDDPDRELKDAFAVFDADGSGTISRSELKKLMKSLGQKLSDAELDAMMDEVDTDGNGEIDFKEFKSMMVRIFSVSLFVCVLLFKYHKLILIHSPILSDQQS